MDGHEANRKCPYAAEGLERGSTSPSFTSVFAKVALRSGAPRGA